MEYFKLSDMIVFVRYKGLSRCRMKNIGRGKKCLKLKGNQETAAVIGRGLEISQRSLSGYGGSEG